MRSATRWHCRSHPDRSRTSSKPSPCSQNSNPTLSLPTRGTTRRYSSKRSRGEASHRSSHPRPTAKEQRQTDFALYRERNLIERFFGKLKQYRGIATRFDKLATTFMAGVLLVSVLIWLN